MRFLCLAVVACIACHHGDSAPPAASCEVAADHVLGLIVPQDVHAKKIRGVFATRCTADGWSSDARACVVGTTSLHDPHHCKAILSADQRAALERDLEAVELAELPKACDAYREMIDKMKACDKLPQVTRDALTKTYDEIARQWSKAAYDRRAMEAQCQTMGDATKQSMTACLR